MPLEIDNEGFFVEFVERWEYDGIQPDMHFIAWQVQRLDWKMMKEKVCVLPARLLRERF